MRKRNLNIKLGTFILIVLLLCGGIYLIDYNRREKLVYSPKSQIDMKEYKSWGIRNKSKEEALNIIKGKSPDIIEFIRKRYALKDLTVENTRNYYKALRDALYVKEIVSEEDSQVRAFNLFLLDIGHDQGELIN